MDMNKAIEIFGIHRTKDDVENIVAALKLFTALNTPEENVKLEAGEYVLAHWKTFQGETARRRNMQAKGVA